MTDYPLNHDASKQLANLVQLLPSSQDRLRTLALVSSNQGEGTSTCTANLAKYLAASVAARVLLVDCNLHHPSVHEMAGVAKENGLIDLLKGEIDLDRAAKPTPIPRLFVLTSGENGGSVVPLDGRLLRDRLLSQTVGYDFVLFDCPPINVYLEATNAAALCDGVILVVEGEKTRRQAAQSAKAQLSQANCKILGVFMNKRKFYIPQAIYERL